LREQGSAWQCPRAEVRRGKALSHPWVNAEDPFVRGIVVAPRTGEELGRAQGSGSFLAFSVSGSSGPAGFPAIEERAPWARILEACGPGLSLRKGGAAGGLAFPAAVAAPRQRIGAFVWI